MNKELQKLLKQINDKKNEVKSLVNDGKLDKARAAKEELVELQNRFDLLYDLDEDEQDGIENKVKDGTAKQVGGDVKPDKKNIVKSFVNIVKAGFLHKEADEADIKVYKDALTSDTITMYTGTITDNQKRTRFDYNGTHFYRDGYYVGKIGTNTMKDNDSQRGLVFDIEYNTAYMSWSNKESQNADVYTMKWSYCTQQCGNYEANMLHAGADINMHFFTLRNVSFEDGSISGTLTFKQPLEVGSDGKLAKWSTATLEFKRGILVSGTWSNG